MTVMVTGIWYVLAIRYTNNFRNKDEAGLLRQPCFFIGTGRS